VSTRIAVSFPDGPERQAWPGLIYIRAKPKCSGIPITTRTRPRYTVVEGAVDDLHWSPWESLAEMGRDLAATAKSQTAMGTAAAPGWSELRDRVAALRAQERGGDGDPVAFPPLGAVITP
jgi:hypothetical protein